MPTFAFTESAFYPCRFSDVTRIQEALQICSFVIIIKASIHVFRSLNSVSHMITTWTRICDELIQHLTVQIQTILRFSTWDPIAWEIRMSRYQKCMINLWKPTCSNQIDKHHKEYPVFILLMELSLHMVGFVFIVNVSLERRTFKIADAISQLSLPVNH